MTAVAMKGVVSSRDREVAELRADHALAVVGAAAAKAGVSGETL